jgi:spore maturation protein CgeB
MKITILGLSITSSWGNGHATTYRSLVKGLHRRGHKVVFLEKNVSWYSSNRDMPDSEYCDIVLYDSVTQLQEIHHKEIENADLVIVGSYVPDGIKVGKWVINTARGIKAFYDIDSPVTIAKLRNMSCEYLIPKMIPFFDLYLSFSAGPCLNIFECEFGSPDVQPLYCSVDPDLYFPLRCKKKWDLGYLGNYSDDRQPALSRLMLESAAIYRKGKFVVAGSQYPGNLQWPSNVERIEHLPPSEHKEFYSSQKFTLNITRSDMVKMGFSPSVRLFEAAACGVPIISDYWSGIYSIFEPGKEILISENSDDTLKFLHGISEKQRKEIGENARVRILKKHTGEQRAIELERYVAANRRKDKKRAGYVLI